MLVLVMITCLGENVNRSIIESVFYIQFDYMLYQQLRKASKCEKEYHYCHLMFAGECWITKIVTVLVDCQVKKKKCCPGYIQDSSTEKLKCIAQSGCGGPSKLTDPRGGQIHSLHYPSHYEPNQKCQWRIEAPPHHLIQLDFGMIELEDSAECKFDRLQAPGTHINDYCTFISEIA